MKPTYLFLILTTWLLPVQSVSAQQQTSTADSIRSWLTYLASDEMMGRANGTPEIETTAQWLSTMYKHYGLKEIGDLTGYIQAYTLDNNETFVHKNIIGYIPAKEESANDDPAIVLTAHFDHIGVLSSPAYNDSIFNGADDNASGTVALLAIAKNLYEQHLQPDCRIVFAAFSNEETGLRGSRYFSESEVITLQKIKLNINFEMLSHSDEFGQNKFYVTGPDHSNFQDLVMEFNKDKDWTIEDIGEMRANMLFMMSDNYTFVTHAKRSNMCIPAHTIATCIGTDSHIHRLNDDVSLVDFENMSRLIDHLTQLVIYMACKEVEVSCK